MRERRAIACLASLCLPYLLAGCALSDPFYIDRSAQSGGNAGAGGEDDQGGRPPAEGGVGGGSGATTGMGKGAGGAATCPASCSGTCCDGVCVEVTNDPAHCGACDVVCARGRRCEAGACSSGWIKTAPPPPDFVARERAATASFDGKIFIFGGLDANGDPLNDAAIYDPNLDMWQVVPKDPSAPSPRQLASAIWTGSSIFVFGGRNAAGSTYFGDGALFDPDKKVWSAVKEGPNVRAAASGGSDGSRIVMWGGLTTDGYAASGADRYDLATRSWASAPSLNSPGPLLGASSAFSGEALYVYGGSDGATRSDRAYRYDLRNNVWSQLARGPSPRSGAFAVWDGAAFYVWGGRNEKNEAVDDGAAFQSSWAALPADGPSARSVLPRQAGWAFALAEDDIVLLGGADAALGLLTDGARFRRSSGWSRFATWPSGEEHAWAAAALAGNEVVLWGGRDGTRVTRNGDRWLAPP